MTSQVVVGLPETLGALQKRHDAILGAVRAVMAQLSMRLSSKAKEDKLSGQVLNVRTGRLRRSITFRVEDQGPLVVGMVGTNVEYAARHEFGGSFDERVRQHMRQMKMAWGREMKNPRAVQVRAHTRHVELPARSFLRSALAEMEPAVRQEIANAVEAANAGA